MHEHAHLLVTRPVEAQPPRRFAHQAVDLGYRLPPTRQPLYLVEQPRRDAWSEDEHALIFGAHG